MKTDYLRLFKSPFIDLIVPENQTEYGFKSPAGGQDSQIHNFDTELNLPVSI